MIDLVTGDFDAHFNSRPPHGGRPLPLSGGEKGVNDFNSRPPHGGRPIRSLNYSPQSRISTHDLHTEVDFPRSNPCRNRVRFQLTTSTRRSTWDEEIHRYTVTFQLTTSTRRSTRSLTLHIQSLTSFQLTTSTRRSTCLTSQTGSPDGYFNSRPPHGGRREFPGGKEGISPFQLTTSTRRSTEGCQILTQSTSFQLTTSTRRSTAAYHLLTLMHPFQLTTSTRRSTTKLRSLQPDPWNFNSRPPHGGRRRWFLVCPALPAFQLTTSTRRSTTRSKRCNHRLQYFNSRPPHGGRPCGGWKTMESRDISTHDLHTEVDGKPGLTVILGVTFQLTTSTRRST